jgi:hypothetical protein
VTDRRDALPHVLRRPGADGVLQRVDVVVEAVDHNEEALGDLVDQLVQTHAAGTSSRFAVATGSEMSQAASSDGGVLRTVTSRSSVATTSISWHVTSPVSSTVGSTSTPNT